jgi:hypothetical protein
MICALKSSRTCSRKPNRAETLSTGLGKTTLELYHSLTFFKPIDNSGPPLRATASTRQYQTATPLGGFPRANPKTGSTSAHLQAPAAVPSISSHVVIKKAARYTNGERPLNRQIKNTENSTAPPTSPCSGNPLIPQIDHAPHTTITVVAITLAYLINSPDRANRRRSRQFDWDLSKPWVTHLRQLYAREDTHLRSDDQERATAFCVLTNGVHVRHCVGDFG